MKTRTYLELSALETFEERFEYLVLHGEVGSKTFGFDRYINQSFYASSEWKQARRAVIIRDNGCDLGATGHEINGELLVHHINPLTAEDIVGHDDWILNPDFLITTTQATHNAIHYGNRSLLPKPFIPRTPGDTKLW